MTYSAQLLCSLVVSAMTLAGVACTHDRDTVRTDVNVDAGTDVDVGADVGGDADAAVDADAGIAIDAVAPDVASIPANALMYAVAAGPIDPCGGTGPDFDIEWAPFDFSDRHRLGDAVNTDADEIWPRISPNRQRFLFYRTPVGFTGETCRYSREELWLADVDGTGVRQIFSNAQRDAVALSLGWELPKVLQGHADWAPDGVHVVMFLGRYTDWLFGLEVPMETQLFVLNVDTGDLRQVTNRRDPVSGDGISSDCSFSTDGEQILFVGCPDTAVAGCTTGAILAVPASAEKATTTVPLYELANSNDVYASPDGTRIAWMEPLAWPIKVAPYRTSSALEADEITIIEPLGGFFSWTQDNRIIFNGGNITLQMNDLDGTPSYPISPVGSVEVFSYPSP